MRVAESATLGPPPFPYYGSKAVLAQRIIDLMPPHDLYVEPFFGSGAVFFAKSRSRVEVINDADDTVVTFFRVLRDRPDDLARICRLTPHARAEFIAADPDGPGINDLERARRFFCRINQSFMFTARSTRGWRMSMGPGVNVPDDIAGKIDRFARVADRLAGVSIDCRDAADLIASVGTADAVIYADPPYLSTTRVANPSRDYRCDMGNEDAHRRLAAALRATPATVILSGYPSALYDELYDGWWTLDIPHQMRVARLRGGDTDRTRVERLWMNRDLAVGRLPLDWGALG